MGKSKVSLSAFIVVCLVFLFPQSATASAKITENPHSLTLAPGQAGTVNIQLTQPIICPGSPCDITLDFSSSQTLGVTVSPATITWDATQWAETRTITVALSSQTSATQSQDVVLTAVTQTNAPYYANLTETVTVSLVIPPAITPAPSTAPEETLANTGREISLAGVIAIASVLIVVGLLFVALTRRRSSLSKKMFHKAH